MQPKWNWDLKPVNLAAENERLADLKGDGDRQEGNPGGKGEAEDALGAGEAALPTSWQRQVRQVPPLTSPAQPSRPLCSDSMAAPPLLSTANFLWVPQS